MNLPPFDDLLGRATDWAERESAQILARGAPLSPAGLVLAQKVGVRCPEKIRIAIVPAVPFPEDPVLRAIAREKKMIAEDTGGMTLFYGIFIRDDQKQRKDIWPHEYRHVAQYECCGSIRTFLSFYLREVIHFEYGPGPFEVDARKAEENA
ncbi:MAG: hypothetical protein ABSC89_11160 [Verrucomicrobiota bacterium]|jgi:hypothetical protein